MSVYHSKLNLMETEKALKDIKTIFERELSSALNLTRISAPLFVTRESGLNDNLNGVERPVSFDIKATGETAEVVHSLAKWKRFALAKYKFGPFFGLYTDMNAIRRDEDLDNLHSLYVDQWDWETVITREVRDVEYLKKTVRKIYAAMQNTAEEICREFPALDNFLTQEITFVTTQELEDLYPDLTPKERENTFVREHGSTFLMQIGAPLRSGLQRHRPAGRPDLRRLGVGTAISFSIIPCSTARSRSLPWGSAWTRNRCTDSWRRKTASTVCNILSTKRSFRASCRSPWAGASDSRACVCSF